MACPGHLGEPGKAATAGMWEGAQLATGDDAVNPANRVPGVAGERAPEDDKCPDDYFAVSDSCRINATVR